MLVGIARAQDNRRGTWRASTMAMGAEEIFAELFQVSQGPPFLCRASWSFKGQDPPSSSVTSLSTLNGDWVC